MQRRSFLMGTASLALAGLAPSRPAAAQSGTLTIGNYGGDWQKRIERIFETDFAAKHKATLTQDLGSGPSRRTKLLAERALPRGSIDVAWFTDNEAFDVQQHDLLTTLDLSKIPNAPRIAENLRSPFYMPWVIAAYGILYNPSKISTPPTAYADLWDPRFAGLVGINDMNYEQNLQIASLITSGKVANTDAAFAKMLEMKKTQKPRFYANHEHLGAAFASGEIAIATNFTARGHQWKNSGIPVEVAYPKEGMLVQTFGVAIPKKAKNPALAYEYLNGLLDPKVMAAMAAESFYVPVVDNATLPPKLEAQIGLSAEQKKIMHLVDYAEIGPLKAPWLDRWNREIK
jgi:putative spermidine/putrescine transport system substrate-binding protein